MRNEQIVTFVGSIVLFCLFVVMLFSGMANSICKGVEICYPAMVLMGLLIASIFFLAYSLTKENSGAKEK